MDGLIDKFYFYELAEADPADVCRRSGCTYDDETKSYALTVWGEVYTVLPLEHLIVRNGIETTPIDDLMGLFIVYYLLKCRELEVNNEWISEKDLPGGVTFFRGPHAIPTGLISEKYIDDIRGFEQRCRQLGGTRLEMADSAFAFAVTTRIPVAVLFWDGDDDFPAEAKLLFDRTLIEHLTFDIIFSLADVVCRKIAGDAGE